MYTFIMSRNHASRCGIFQNQSGLKAEIRRLKNGENLRATCLKYKIEVFARKEDGKVSGYVIKDKQRTELNTLTEFYKNISHEKRTPYNYKR